MNQKPSRTVRGWVVIGRFGNLYFDTVRELRRDCISAYDRWNEWSHYAEDRRKHGVKAVRCTITTEPDTSMPEGERG